MRIPAGFPSVANETAMHLVGAEAAGAVKDVARDDRRIVA